MIEINPNAPEWARLLVESMQAEIDRLQNEIEALQARIEILEAP